ncbi:MAG: substrate-binding domain-containing protein [Propioniciclava sp.]
MHRTKLFRAAGTAALLVALAACSVGGGTEPSSTSTGAGSDDSFIIGVSNTVAGNGWREQLICAVKAEALVSGKVSKVIAISKNGGPTEQIQDLQSLISQGVNAIIVNPSDLEKLNPIIDEAHQQGIVVVAVDSPVSSENAYIAVTDQQAWGRLNAEWLFEKIGGSGKVLYMRGIEGVPADTDRDAGFREALAAYPDITVKEVWTGWDYTKAGEVAVSELSAAGYDGIWTSGTDYTVVNALATAGVDPVPVTGQDTNAFVKQLVDGADGAVITNPAIIGGIGADIAIRALSGESPERETLLTPTVLDPATDLAVLQEEYAPDRDDLWSTTVGVEGLTHFTREQMIACVGPGE